jgi:hypothetical protein
MLPDLRRQIERYADRYAEMVHNGENATMLAAERYGRLLGLCYAYRELVYNDVRAVRGMVEQEIEAAQVRLGYIDAEGYAVEGAE